MASSDTRLLPHKIFQYLIHGADAGKRKTIPPLLMHELDAQNVVGHFLRHSSLIAILSQHIMSSKQDEELLL